MKKLAALAITLSLMALGIEPQNTFADTTTTRWGMTKPDVGSTNWGPKINSNYDIIDNAAGVGITNTFTQPNYFTGVVVIGGTTYSGSGDAELRKDQNTTTTFRITNVNNNASAGAELLLTANGATSNDPFLGFVTNAQNWAMGVDSSASSAFKISKNPTLGSTDLFIIYPTCQFVTELKINSIEFTGITGSNTRSVLANPGTAATDGAVYLAYVQAGTSGDPYSLYSMGNTSYWSAGMDNSDGNSYVISNSSTPGTSNAFRATLTGVSMLGTTTNNSAASGWVGQYISSTTIIATSYPTSSQYGDLVALALTAGDWDVTGVIGATANGGTISQIAIGISYTAGNSSFALVQGDNLNFGPGPTIAADAGQTMPNVRVSINTPTTYYLKYRSDYSVATPKAVGRISARRVR